jgi:hypothetical protein
VAGIELEILELTRHGYIEVCSSLFHDLVTVCGVRVLEGDRCSDVLNLNTLERIHGPPSHGTMYLLRFERGALISDYKVVEHQNTIICISSPKN